MGRKKKQIVNLKPFCFYCDKEFNNELILHQHQKSRHFNCIKCKKRFSTAPALDTHYFHFHQEKLKNVPNAKRGRDTFDISIYGMDGVPIELIQYKLAEKVEKKRKKIYNEELKKLKEKNKNENDNNNNAEIEKEKKEKKDKILKYLESKNDEIDKLLHSNNLTGQFYHNPNSINLTMKQKQMAQMYLNNNVNDNNSGKNNINNIINQINNNIQETNKSLNINNDNNNMDNNINDNNIDNNNNNENNNNDNNINDNIDINNINNNNIINKNNDYKMEEDNVD